MDRKGKPTNDLASPLAALSTQILSEAPLPTGLGLLRGVIQRAVENRLPESEASFKLAALKATNYEDLLVELISLRNEAQALVWILDAFCHALPPLIPKPESD